MNPQEAIQNFQALIDIYKGTRVEHEALASSVQVLKELAEKGVRGVSAPSSFLDKEDEFEQAMAAIESQAQKRAQVI